MARSRLGIVIPAFNEASTIGAVVKAVAVYGTPIVVDDGSSDLTSQFASAAGAVVVSHTRNKGYDAALNSGFVSAAELGCDFIVTMDADGQHDPTFLPAFLQELERGADVVVGVRDKRQRLAEHVFAFVSRKLWGISDPLCGLKAYRIEIYLELGHFDSYNSIGTELAIYASRNKKMVTQLQVTTRERLDSPRFGKCFSSNQRIFRALINAFI